MNPRAILTAVLALAIAIAVAIHFFPATTVNITHVAFTAIPTETKFRSDTIKLNNTNTVNQLFLAETLTLDNQLRTPLFVDKFTLTITTPQGELIETAIPKQQFSDLKLNFPPLEPILAQPQLLPEDTIAPGKQKTGTILFSTRLPQADWATRTSAVIKVDLYHQNPVYLTIPK